MFYSLPLLFLKTNQQISQEKICKAAKHRRKEYSKEEVTFSFVLLRTLNFVIDKMHYIKIVFIMEVWSFSLGYHFSDIKK